MKKILLIIDVQNDFITGTLASNEAQNKIANIVNKIKEFDGNYIFMTRDTHNENYLQTKEGENLPVEHCIINTNGWEIEESVANAFIDRLNDSTSVVGFIVNKPTFGSRELVEKIKELVNDEEFEIEICGFCTSICVISNTLLIKESFYNTANITVDASCCACVTPETHKSGIEVMKCCQIKIVNE